MALYDGSDLGSTITTAEWSCLISFAWVLLNCSERTGRERKVQNENISHLRDSNPRQATPRQVYQRFRPLG